MPEGQVFVIPVRLDDCEVPDRFRHLHYADLFTSSGLDAVIAAIKSELRRETSDNSVPGGGAPQSRTAMGSIEDGLVGLSIYTQRTQYVNFLLINPKTCQLPAVVPLYSFVHTELGLVSHAPSAPSTIGVEPEDYEELSPRTSQTAR